MEVFIRGFKPGRLRSTKPGQLGKAGKRGGGLGVLGAVVGLGGCMWVLSGLVVSGLRGLGV